MSLTSAPVSIARAVLFPAVTLLTLGAGGCHQGDRLLLLDVRASGELVATVANVRFSASGWPTRQAPSTLVPQGLLFGYYGPPGSGAVTITAEALDASNCVLAQGATTVLNTSSGATAPKTIMYVRPLPTSVCTPADAGTDAADADAGTDASDASDAADTASQDAPSSPDATHSPDANAVPDAGAPDLSLPDTSQSITPDASDALSPG